MQRRGFLASILAAGVAPAFVGARVLMPVKSIVAPAPGIALLDDSTMWAVYPEGWSEIHPSNEGAVLWETEIQRALSESSWRYAT